MIKVETIPRERIAQGDILRDIDYLEGFHETEGNIELSRIHFPLVIVLTQDCDLEQDKTSRVKNLDAVKVENKLVSHDKYLLSVLVAPLYNLEHLLTGEHLSELGLNMQTIDRKNTMGKLLLQNTNPRYHFLEFPNKVPIVPSVIDFKHYFSTNVNVLQERYASSFVCGVSELYRESISQRFSNFLSRIGLP